MKITVLFERLGPYHAARLNAAASCCQLTAIEVQRTDEIYAWDELDQVGFSRASIYKSSGERRGFSDLRQRVEESLALTKPDAVAIHGWSEPAALLALRWCRANRVPAIVMSESSERDAPRNQVGELIKRRVVGQFSAGLVGGHEHQEYLSKLGLPVRQCVLGYDVVDNAYFESEAALARRDAERIRHQLNLPRRYFLASCRFIEKKNVERLIGAYSQYHSACGDATWDLVILGDGPLCDRIHGMVDTYELAEYVHLPGFRQYAELPAYYAMAGAFVHASTIEQWGLVVNEAMACGLPVIVSNRCGCSDELVDGSNGWTFDPFDVEQLSACFRELTELSDQELNRLGNTSFRRIQKWSPMHFANGLTGAARIAIGQSREDWSWKDDRALLVLAWKRRNQLKNQVAI
ncbi:glycosyltransferase [Allorhodopirellula solitaria]|uniref:Alpha-monoglucosyldiacylglycerol synthase n=1 Tax=Allorhodopirellula solitaria TaxID=2527987 RepID=A0A5C5YCW2_9BACT|nr:glycosyltransferase [Allorhodopirellula solitaria]TWT72934.1 Alpha-monoglucosyldiacylglycerol synthase [Allorhodopirellula solitaria]